MKYFLCALAIIIFAVPALAFEPEPGEKAVYAGQNFTDEVKILLRRAGFNIQKHPGYEGGQDRRDGALKWIEAASKDARWKALGNYPDKHVEVMSSESFKLWLEQ